MIRTFSDFFPNPGTVKCEIVRLESTPLVPLSAILIVSHFSASWISISMPLISNDSGKFMIREVDSGKINAPKN